MFRRRRRSVVYAMVVLCSVQFFYHLLELSTIDRKDAGQGQRPSLETEGFHLPPQQQDSQKQRILPGTNLLPFKDDADREADLQVASTTMPTASADKSANVNSSSLLQATGTDITKKQLGPIEALQRTIHTTLPTTCRSVDVLKTPDTVPAWQPVLKNSSYVYSAFLDRRLHNQEIKLFGISAMFSKHETPKFCHIWYKNSTVPVIVKARDGVLPDDKSLP